MADDVRGVPYHSLLLPNGLSFLRLSLAPLVLMPCLITPAHPATAPIFAVFIAGLAVTDVLDGWHARRQKICTRLGHMLDYLGDLAFLAFLAMGLYLAAAIPGSLLLILIIRYPLSLIGVVILYFLKGPARLTPTVIGRVTTLATSVLLLVIAGKLLLATNLPPSMWIDWSVQGVQLLIAANIVYLVYRSVTWGISEAPANSSSTK
jgi:phosphatidylglycerophosphate synthase